MVSALVNSLPREGGGVTGGKWFSLVGKVIRSTTLDAAWRKVARNKGASGVDGQSIERFAAQAEQYLHELHDDMKDGSYRPSPVRRVEIPKGDGRTRPLGIPTIKDRIVQTAQPDASAMVWLLQACHASFVRRPRRLRAPTPARHPAQAGKAPRHRTMRSRPPTLAQCLLRRSWAVHPSHRLRAGETLPMRKPTTGEPCAGEPDARFGGRGGNTFPTPIENAATGGSSFSAPGITFQVIDRRSRPS